MSGGGEENRCRFCGMVGCVTRANPDCLRRIQELAEASQGGTMGDNGTVQPGQEQAQSEVGVQPATTGEATSLPCEPLTDEQRLMLGGV